MSISLVCHTKKGGNSGGVTSDAIDTTGAKILIAHTSTDNGGTPSFSDSKGNTWTALTQQSEDAVRSRLYYCINPTVGSGHTFSVSGSSIYAGIAVRGYSCAGGTDFVYESQNGAHAPGATTLNTGSVTPTVNGALIITGCADNASGSRSINSGFSIGDEEDFNPGNSYSSSLADLIQGTAGAVNPQWTGPTANRSVTIAVFREQAGVDTTPPSDVTGLTAAKVSDSQVDIDSNAATDNVAVGGYITERRIDGGSWVTIESSLKVFSDGPAKTSFPSTPGTYSLEYRRKAFDTATPTPNQSTNWSSSPAAVEVTVEAEEGDFVWNSPRRPFHYRKHPADWQAVTRDHEYEDGGKSFNELNSTAPQRWDLVYTGLTPEEDDEFTEHFDEMKLSNPFTFIGKEGTYTDVYYEKSESSHDGNKSWVRTRSISLVKYP